ncbi:MAG: polysaccharide lyase [Bryobacteraceae bacterium]
MKNIATFISVGLLLSSVSERKVQAQSITPLPSGNNGIAAKYAGDANIKSDPAVIFADDFESYTSSSDLWKNWSNVYQQVDTRIATESGNTFSGSHALEFKVPRQTSEIANAVEKALSPMLDTVFVRVYTKFGSGFNATGSEHNGISIGANYCCAGVPANGTNKFLVDVENSRDYPNDTSYPGFTNSYVYYPEQRDVYGDHWYPDGTELPYSSTPGNFGTYFVKRPNFTPAVNRWYSYELMVKANTPGQRDGRVAIWIDGNLVADFQNVRLRDVNTLKIDKVSLDLYIKSNSSSTDYFKYYDNVVIASSYIGPMSTTNGSVAPPTGLSATAK